MYAHKVKVLISTHVANKNKVLLFEEEAVVAGSRLLPGQGRLLAARLAGAVFVWCFLGVCLVSIRCLCDVFSSVSSRCRCLCCWVGVGRRVLRGWSNLRAGVSAGVVVCHRGLQ